MCNVFVDNINWSAFCSAFEDNLKMCKEGILEERISGKSKTFLKWFENYSEFILGKFLFVEEMSKGNEKKKKNRKGNVKKNGKPGKICLYICESHDKKKLPQVNSTSLKQKLLN